MRLRHLASSLNVRGEEEDASEDDDEAADNVEESESSPLKKRIWRRNEEFSPEVNPTAASVTVSENHGDWTPQDYFKVTPKSPKVTPLPSPSARYSAADHMPVLCVQKNASRCRMPGCRGKSRIKCEKCRVFLCLQGQRNCFKTFHKK